VMQCLVPGVTPVASNLINSGKDFLRALKDMSFGELGAVLSDLGNACMAIKPMLEDCDPAHQDALDVLRALKGIHGPKDLFSHIWQDLTSDMDNVESEADLSFKTWRAKEYFDFGDHLGMLLHRLVIGRFPDGIMATSDASEIGTGPSPATISAFTLGFLGSILSDKPHLTRCELGGLRVLTPLHHLVDDANELIKHHNMSYITPLFMDMANLCAAIGPVKTMCDPAWEDAKEIHDVMKDIHGLGGWVEHIKSDIDNDIDKIESESDLAFKTWRKEPRDYEKFGKHLGEALRRTVIGKYDDEEGTVRGEEIQCFGARAHKVTYSHSDGDTLDDISDASILVERDASADAQCVSNSPAEDDKPFCFGVNVDESCEAPQSQLPIIDGFTCTNCFGGATTDLYYKFETRRLKLQTVEVGLKNTHIKGALELTAGLDAAKDLAVGTLDLLDRSFEVNFKAGKIPVNLKVGMTGQLGYSLRAEGSLHAVSGADLDIDFGEHFISWDDANGWQKHNSAPSVTATPILTVDSAEAGAHLGASLSSTIKFEANDVLWYHVNVNPEFPGSLSYVHENKQICLNADLDLPVTHEADLHHRLLGHDITIKHFGPAEIMHIEKPGFIHKCVGTPAMAVSGEEIQCFGARAHKVTYSHSDGETLDNISDASILVERDASADAQCVSSSPAEDDKPFCIGVNVDESCEAPQSQLPIVDGFTCTNCFGGVTTDLYYKFETRRLKLQKVEVGLKNTHIKGALELTTGLDAAKDLAEGTLDLLDRTFEVNFNAGKIPVNLKVDMTGQLGFSLGAEGSLHAVSGADLDIDFGEHFISWDDANGWQRHNSAPAVTATPILTVDSAEAGAQLATSFSSTIKFEANDVLWYHVNVNPAFPGSLSYVHEDKQLCLQADLDLPVTHEADLHHRLLGHDITIKHFGPAEIVHIEKPGFFHKCVETPFVAV